MEFVVWGCGFRGNSFFDFMKGEHIKAFIDSNKEKQGTVYLGKPVISIDQYCIQYQDCMIVVSPKSRKACGEIERELKARKICQYAILSDESYILYEPLGVGANIFKDFPLDIELEKKYGIVGCNIFSILIFEFLKEKNVDAVLIGKGERASFLEWVCRYYKDIAIDVSGKWKREADTVWIADNTDKKTFRETYKGDYTLEDCYDFDGRWNEIIHKEIAKFKNKYLGKRCFIVATGPSLKVSDLEKLHDLNEFCISMNMVTKVFKDTNWRPNCYLSLDTHLAKSTIREFADLELEMKIVVDPVFRKGGEEAEIIKNKKDIYLVHVNSAEREKMGFSEDLEVGLFGGGTSTYGAMQIAVYMGFSEIYLLGLDFSFADNYTDKSNHFIEDYFDHNIKITESASLLKEKNYQAYIKAKEYADSHGIKIYNATRGGKLEVFERKDIEQVFKEIENHGM